MVRVRKRATRIPRFSLRGLTASLHKSTRQVQAEHDPEAEEMYMCLLIVAVSLIMCVLPWCCCAKCLHSCIRLCQLILFRSK